MNGASVELRAERVGPEHARALAGFFEQSGCACFCRYWHFQGDKNAWLDRLANHPLEGKAEMDGALAARSPEMAGVVAESGARVVGFMKLAPAAALGKLYAQRLYRGLPCFEGDRTGVLAIGCFLVDPEFRRHGVARALLSKGIEIARTDGARAIEAFPRRAENVSDGELWMGPLSLFTEAGFREVHAFQQYPVLRLELKGSTRPEMSSSAH